MRNSSTSPFFPLTSGFPSLQICFSLPSSSLPHIGPALSATEDLPTHLPPFPLVALTGCNYTLPGPSQMSRKPANSSISNGTPIPCMSWMCSGTLAPWFCPCPHRFTAYCVPCTVPPSNRHISLLASQCSVSGQSLRLRAGWTRRTDAPDCTASRWLTDTCRLTSQTPVIRLSQFSTLRDYSESRYRKLLWATEWPAN